MPTEILGSIAPGQPVPIPGDYRPESIDPMQNVVTDSEGDDSPSTPANRDTGWLLEEKDEKKVAAKIVQWWNDQDDPMENRKTRWKAFRWWRQGKRFVRLVQEAERSRVYAPPQSAQLPPSPNRCDSLMRKIVATIMVDPPAPECEPGSGEDADRDAAELSQRLLEAFGGDRQMTIVGALEDALDKAGTYCTGFIYAEVTPNGRMEPKQVEAHPAAVDAANPLVNPQTGLADGQVTLRYVTLDGKLADDAVNAEREWVPDIDLCTLTGHHVRFLPETSNGLQDAYGVLICKPMTLGALRALSPDIEWTDDKIKRVAAYRPHGWEDTLPVSMRSDVARIRTEQDGKTSDDTLVFPLKCYLRETADYENGAYLLVTDADVLYRGPWGGVAAGPGGKDRWETFMLPVVPVRFMDDHQGDDPYGDTLVRILGPMDDILATHLASTIQFADRVNKPREYIPMGSVVQPEQLRRRDGRPIMYNAEAGLPIIEQIGQYPSVVQWVIQYISDQMDSESGLTAQAQGQSTPSVRSNEQQQALIERSVVNVANVKRNTDAAYVQLCRLLLQLMRVYFTAPQRVRYVGKDGAYKERHWSRSDLRGTSDVRIRRGSSTMMPLSVKLSLAREELDLGMKAQDPLAYIRYQQTLGGRLDPILGMQQDATLQRVRGQIEAWGSGPPEDAQGDENAMGQAAITLFQPLPVDDDPFRAQIRYRELSHAMETDVFKKHAPHPAWQQGFTQAWLLAKNAAGIMTIPEQQQQAQQQAEAQQQAAQQQQQGQQQAAQQVLQQKQGESQQALQQRQAEHDQKMTFSQQDHALKIQQKSEQGGDAQPPKK